MQRTSANLTKATVNQDVVRELVLEKIKVAFLHQDFQHRSEACGYRVLAALKSLGATWGQAAPKGRFLCGFSASK
jgi:uncharacterized protein (DUF736 family)